MENAGVCGLRERRVGCLVGDGVDGDGFLSSGLEVGLKVWGGEADGVDIELFETLLG